MNLDTRSVNNFGNGQGVPHRPIMPTINVKADIRSAFEHDTFPISADGIDRLDKSLVVSVIADSIPVGILRHGLSERPRNGFDEISNTHNHLLLYLRIADKGSQDFQEMMNAGRKEGLVFSPSTELYAAMFGEVVVGMCGIVWYTNHAKAKNDYVKPEYRGRGYYLAMFNWRIERARQRGCRWIGATCTAAALPEWLKHGAIILNRYQRYTKVRLPL